MESNTGSQLSAASDASLANDAHSAYDSDSTHFSEEEPVPDVHEGDLTVDEGSQENGVDWDSEFADTAVEFDPSPELLNSEIPLNRESTQLEILQMFITGDMVRQICDESNRYASQKKIKDHKPLTTPEFWRFIAINLAMGIVKKPTIADYWAVKSKFATPFFNSVMTRDRYVQLLRALHFVNNATITNTFANRFVKLGSLLDDLFENVRKVIKLGEYLSLDESFVPFKGRLAIKQYNPKKRARFGVKLFVLADCATKIIFAILPYQGKLTKLKFRDLIKDLGFGGVAVLTMLEPYLDKGHRVIVDNYFNSPKLARKLKARKTYILGTVQKRRKGMPRIQRMTRKMKKGEVKVFSDGDILVERWSDRREVCMLNTFMPHVMVNVESSNPNNTRDKPGTVILYNAKMGAVDDADKVIAPVASVRKSYKWYRKVAFRLVDLAVYNAFQLSKLLTNKSTKYRTFVDKMIDEILATYPKPEGSTRGRPPHVRDDQRLSGHHFPHKVLMHNGKSSNADCVYCKIVHKKRKSTVYGCRQCKKRLCVGPSVSCFELYHTQATLRKVATVVPDPPSQSPEVEMELPRLQVPVNHEELAHTGSIQVPDLQSEPAVGSQVTPRTEASGGIELLSDQNSFDFSPSLLS